MSEVIYTTDIINIQLNNLLICHDYRVEYKLHYARTQFSAELDKYSFNFRSSSSFQNAFVLLTKDSRIDNVLVEVNVFDTTDDNNISYSTFVACPGYDSCDPINPSNTPTPTATSTVTPSLTATPTVTPTFGASPTPTPTFGASPTPTPTITVTPSTVGSSNFVASYFPDYNMSINFRTNSNGLVDFGDGDTRIFGDNTTVTKTATGWTARESNRDWNGVASSADGTKLVAVVTGGQIYTSTNSGVSWTARESIRNWYGVASSADGTKLVAVVLSGQIYTSTNSGVSWTARESNRSWYGVASSADGTKLVAVVYSGQIYTSSDSGVSWTARESNRNWYGVASSADGTKLVAVVYGGQIYTSSDSGVSWTARESSRFWNDVASSADGTKLVAVVISGQIYTSTDSGVSWIARAIGSLGWSGVASSADGNKLVAVALGGQQIYTISARTLTVSSSYYKITFVNNSSSNLMNLGLVSIDSWGNLTNIDNMFSNSFGGFSYGVDGLSSFPGNIAPTVANGAFDGCTGLDTDLTGFSLVNLNSNNLNTFMRGVTLSNTNYNKILAYWNTNKNSYPLSDYIIHMGNSKADTSSGGINGISAKLSLVSFGWTITDADGTVT